MPGNVTSGFLVASFFFSVIFIIFFYLLGRRRRHSRGPPVVPSRWLRQAVWVIAWRACSCAPAAGQRKI